LDDAGAVLARDRGARLVQSVDDPPLVEELRLGRVHVLRLQRVVVVEPARLEAEHPAAAVGEREEQPALEVVVAALACEARRAELVEREPLLERLPHERRPAEGEPEPELATDGLLEAAALQVVAGHPADLGVPERPLVERRRLVEERKQAVAPPPRRLLGRRALLVLERDAEPLGKPLDRAGEVEALRLAHEGDEVALRAAAEAVVELVDRVDGERRRALVVEGAAARVTRARLAQLGAPGDDLHEVGRRLHRLDRGVLDPRHQSRSAYDSANLSVIPATNSTTPASSSPRPVRCPWIRRIVRWARSCSGRVSGPR